MLDMQGQIFMKVMRLSASDVAAQIKSQIRLAAEEEDAQNEFNDSSMSQGMGINRFRKAAKVHPSSSLSNCCSRETRVIKVCRWPLLAGEMALVGW